MLPTSRAHAGAALVIFALALAVAPQACSLNPQGELYGVGDTPPGSTTSGGGSSAMSGSSGGLGGGGGGTTSSTGPGATGSGTGQGGAGAGGAGGAGGDVGGAGGVGGSVGQGGAANVCGNGIIEPGEECDDKGLPNDSCVACQVICTPVQAYEDPATHHCYYFSVVTSTWSVAVSDCNSLGYYLAAMNTQAEIDFLKDVPASDLWVGASKSGASWSWLDGEALNPLFWEFGQPDNLDELCVELGSKNDGDAGLLNNVTCDTVQPYLCEWTPPGMP